VIVTRSNGTVDTFPDQSTEEDHGFGGIELTSVVHSYEVTDTDVLKIIRRSHRRNAMHEWRLEGTEEVAYYRAQLWENVRKD